MRRERGVSRGRGSILLAAVQALGRPGGVPGVSGGRRTLDIHEDEIDGLPVARLHGLGAVAADGGGLDAAALEEGDGNADVDLDVWRTRGGGHGGWRGREHVSSKEKGAARRGGRRDAEQQEGGAQRRGGAARRRRP